MKIAYLVLCHKNPNQIKRMIDNLSDEDTTFYIHIDKKSNFDESILKDDNVIILDKSERISVEWGQISQVEAAVALIKKASDSNVKYDYVCMLSGQDFPIKSKTYIKDYLTKNNGYNFMQVVDKNSDLHKRYLKRNQLYYPKWMISRKTTHRILKKLYITFTGGSEKTYILKRKNKTNLEFYFGSLWWCITYDFFKHLNDTLQNSNVMDFYENTVCPDESIFATILMNSKYSQKHKNYLTYIDWSENNSSPKTFKTGDYKEIIKSGYLFARKFDEDVDSKIFDLIENNTKNI